MSRVSHIGHLPLGFHRNSCGPLAACCSVAPFIVDYLRNADTMKKFRAYENCGFPNTFGRCAHEV